MRKSTENSVERLLKVMINAIIHYCCCYYEAECVHAFMEIQNRLRPLGEERSVGMGGVKIWEGFLEEMPIKGKQSGSLVLPASGTRRNRDQDSFGPQNKRQRGGRQEDTSLRRAGSWQELGCVHGAVIPCISKATMSLVMKL